METQEGTTSDKTGPDLLQILIYVGLAMILWPLFVNIVLTGVRAIADLVLLIKNWAFQKFGKCIEIVLEMEDGTVLTERVTRKEARKMGIENV